MAQAQKPSVTIGQAIRELRLERDLTQEAVAYKADVTVGQLSKIEREQSDPRLSTLVKIASGLQVPLPTLAEKMEALADRQESVGT